MLLSELEHLKTSSMVLASVLHTAKQLTKHQYMLPNGNNANTVFNKLSGIEAKRIELNACMEWSS